MTRIPLTSTALHGPVAATTATTGPCAVYASMREKLCLRSIAGMSNVVCGAGTQTSKRHEADAGLWPQDRVAEEPGGAVPAAGAWRAWREHRLEDPRANRHPAPHRERTVAKPAGPEQGTEPCANRDGDLQRKGHP